MAPSHVFTPLLADSAIPTQLPAPALSRRNSLYDMIPDMSGMGPPQQQRRRSGFSRHGSLGGIFRLKHSESHLKVAEALPRCLSFWELIPLGVGATIGAGVYVLIGTVAKYNAGPSLPLSFLVAGAASALSAFCYAELSSRCPSAGSAYHYAYTTVGEIVAWLIGWALILEYTVGGAAVARGISPNLAVALGGPENMPFILSRMPVPGTEIILDPCAAIAVALVSALLGMGMKESAMFQSVVTATNIMVLTSVVVIGAVVGTMAGWPGYAQMSHTGGYFPFGVEGTLAASAVVFYSYIGFDAVCTAAEEVKRPQVDLPLGIGMSLSLCAALFMSVAAVLVGLVPFNEINPDTPMSDAFDRYNLPWAKYLVTGGALMALSTTLLGSILPQPRILMAMARDGLLPPWFAKLSPQSGVPLNATVVTGLFAASLAFTMNIQQLSAMVSVGTLLAFSVVNLSVLILRYVPPKSSLSDPGDTHASAHGSSGSLFLSANNSSLALSLSSSQSNPHTSALYINNSTQYNTNATGYSYKNSGSSGGSKGAGSVLYVGSPGPGSWQQGMLTSQSGSVHTQGQVGPLTGQAATAVRSGGTGVSGDGQRAGVPSTGAGAGAKPGIASTGAGTASGSMAVRTGIVTVGDRTVPGGGGVGRGGEGRDRGPMFPQLGSMTNSSMGLSPAVTVLNADHLNAILRSSMEEDASVNPVHSSQVYGEIRGGGMLGGGDTDRAKGGGGGGAAFGANGSRQEGSFRSSLSSYPTTPSGGTGALQCYGNAGRGMSVGSESGKYSESGALVFGGEGVRMSGVESIFSGGATPEAMNSVPGMGGALYSGAATPEGLGHGGVIVGGVFSGVATPEGMDLDFAPAVDSPAVAGQVAAGAGVLSTEGMVGPPAGTGIAPSGDICRDATLAYYLPSKGGQSQNISELPEQDLPLPSQAEASAPVTGQKGNSLHTAQFTMADETVQYGASEVREGENEEGSRDSSGHPSGGSSSVHEPIGGSLSGFHLASKTQSLGLHGTSETGAGAIPTASHSGTHSGTHMRGAVDSVSGEGAGDAGRDIDVRGEGEGGVDRRKVRGKREGQKESAAPEALESGDWVTALRRAAEIREGMATRAAMAWDTGVPEDYPSAGRGVWDSEHSGVPETSGNGDISSEISNVSNSNGTSSGVIGASDWGRGGAPGMHPAAHVAAQALEASGDWVSAARARLAGNTAIDRNSNDTTSSNGNSTVVAEASGDWVSAARARAAADSASGAHSGIVGGEVGTVTGDPVDTVTRASTTATQVPESNGLVGDGGSAADLDPSIGEETRLLGGFPGNASSSPSGVPVGIPGAKPGDALGAAGVPRGGPVGVLGVVGETQPLGFSPSEQRRRRVAGFAVVAVAVGFPVVAAALSWKSRANVMSLRWTVQALCAAFGGALGLGGATVLCCISQDTARHRFGTSGGFECPGVPFLPLVSFLINAYLLVNLGTPTLIRSGIWLLMGATVYLTYGMWHSSLAETGPTARVMRRSQRTKSWWQVIPMPRQERLGRIPEAAGELS